MKMGKWECCFEAGGIGRAASPRPPRWETNLNIGPLRSTPAHSQIRVPRGWISACAGEFNVLRGGLGWVSGDPIAASEAELKRLLTLLRS